MDKIYSRRRIKLPKYAFVYQKRQNPNYPDRPKILKLTCIIIIGFITAGFILQSISPIIDKQCINMAKSIATKISNEQATVVMSKYQYEDLCIITKDSSRQY